MKKNLKTLLAFFVIAMSAKTNGWSQTDTARNSYIGFSLQELLNIKINSASKKTESLMDAPLSASVVTREDIQKAGCTSVMEAMRLVPGMIVREQSNGNYDIHLRGMDNVPPNAPFDGSATTTLVMIDNRPIYNYLKGGTFWEALPVDINDVEKIEIVRGPAAALYGPNAVNGVINIITRQLKKKGLNITANAQHGSYNTFINNASVGYKSDKWSLTASGNYQHRDRSQTSYFEFFRNRWLEQPAYSINILGDTVHSLPNPNARLAMKKYAGNIFLSYDAAAQIKFTLSAGIQHSVVQKVSTENGITPLSTVASDSRYADIRANIKGLSAQFTLLKGTQTPIYPGNKYDFNTIDANIEYNYTKGGLSLKPGFSYRSAVYDDTKYSDIVSKNGIFNARGQIITKTVSLRGEYKMLDNKLRLIAGIAANKFNFPDETYISYQAATTYKVNKKHLFRAVYSQAPRSAIIYDTYVDQMAAKYPIGYQKYMMLTVEGNKNLKLLEANMLEFGYRGTIAKRLTIEAEVFDIRSKNYNSLVTNSSYVTLIGNDTILATPLIATNLPVILHQQGITISVAIQLVKAQIKPFITFQRSRIKHYAPFLNTPDADWPLLDNPTQNNIYSGIGTEILHKGTPAVFGGASFNWLPSTKLNVNLNTYYYTSQTYYHASNIAFYDGVRGIDQIKAKCIVNASVFYEAAKGLAISCSAKNILNQKSREFFGADKAPFMLMAGLYYEF